jgi:hypothetical protein
MLLCKDIRPFLAIPNDRLKGSTCLFRNSTKFASVEPRLEDSQLLEDNDISTAQDIPVYLAGFLGYEDKSLASLPREIYHLRHGLGSSSHTGTSVEKYV